MVNLPTFNNNKSNSNNDSIQKNRNNNSLPFNIIIIATITINAIAWIIAFAGSIAASQTIDFFPKFTWWGLVFELFIVIGLPVLYFLNLLHQYHQFLLSILTIAFIYTSNSTNNLVYYTDSSSSAAGTGFILLSMVNFLWLFYLGSDKQSPPIKFIDSFDDKSTQINYNNNNNNNNYNNKRVSSFRNTRGNSYSYGAGNQSTVKLNNNNNVHELEGFENRVNSNTLSEDLEFNDSAYRQSGIINLNPPQIDRSNTINDNEGTNFTGISSVTNYMENYPILVRSLYDYNANPEDVNELSFKKGEVFRVKNTNGNWWQAKNKNGEIGMCPSNYLEIVT